MVSRWAHNSKVGGSKPLSAIFLFLILFNIDVFKQRKLSKNSTLLIILNVLSKFYRSRYKLENRLIEKIPKRLLF